MLDQLLELVYCYSMFVVDFHKLGRHVYGMQHILHTCGMCCIDLRMFEASSLIAILDFYLQHIMLNINKPRNAMATATPVLSAPLGAEQPKRQIPSVVSGFPPRKT